MKTTRAQRRRREQAALMTEMVVALAILTAVMIPISMDFLQEARLCRAYYNDAVAMELVDGEMEVLAAGEWLAFAEGEHRYSVKAASATNLPPGQFMLTRRGDTLRLEWLPSQPGKGRRVTREVRIKP